LSVGPLAPCMARVEVKTEVELDAPSLVEGLPGVGLVGKIAADHLVDELGMTYHAGVYCEGLPRVAVYGEDSSDVSPPVRLYADAGRDLLVLRSDVPVSPESATEFATCLTGWFHERGVTPLLLSGRPQQGSEEGDGNERDHELPLYGVATGEGGSLLEEIGVGPPDERGLLSGPTGALMARAEETGLTALGLVVGADPRFPDPRAAKRLLDDAILPLTGVDDVDTSALLDRAEEIRQARERLARRMQEGSDESSQAQPLRMFQ